ncbi:MAG: tRNA guanosine(34) transglycosylase Tgt [Deltaproteobacteria bacterium]|nr:tRNA guanosine(34) transglycosylase Tgt [Deltaproteobacteria bacterium]
MFEFTIEARDATTAARCGRFATPHGGFETPIFMPVGTAGSVKALGPDDLEAVGAEIILGNTYHLMLRPGAEALVRLGGLHRMMAWPRSILTDSGGFQVFSLAALRRIDESGVEFRSHLDGSSHFLSPERSLEIQSAIGSDIAMALDVCPRLPASRAEVEEAMRLTTLWLGRCVAAWRQDDPGSSPPAGGQALFGIVQGGVDEGLRRRHSEEICSHDLPGFAIGGLSVGEDRAAMRAACQYTAALLPADRPRYLMGIGTPADLVCAIADGIDMFDCVMPTRNARNGSVFTSTGRLAIKNACFALDPAPLDAQCRCYTCRTFSRAYLRHLFVARELLVYRLLSLHNLTYYLDLMHAARAAIRAGTLSALRDRTCALFDA